LHTVEHLLLQRADGFLLGIDIHPAATMGDMGIGQQGQTTAMIQMTVRQQHGINLQHGGGIQLADAAAAIEQTVIVHLETGGTRCLIAAG
jgi:hypothetical protein